MLIDPAKELMFKLVQMVFREIDNGLCFDPLDASTWWSLLMGS
jgi:hypothetical protein